MSYRKPGHTRGETTRDDTPFVRPRPSKAELLCAARSTAEQLAQNWGPEDAAAVGMYETRGAVVVFGHPPQGYFAVIWDRDAYQDRPGETRVGVWDGLTIVHGQT